MFIIDCIPLKKIPRGHPQVLSYFHSEPVETGSIALAPIRKKDVPMAVTASVPIRERKASVRSKEYQLKPLTEIICGPALLPPHLFSLLLRSADYFFVPLTYIFSYALPPARILLSPTFRKAAQTFSSPSTKQVAKKDRREDAITAENAPLAIVKRVDRALGKGNNILFLTPHDVHIPYWKKVLSETIAEEKIITYTRSTRITEWAHMCAATTAARGAIIIGGPSAIFAPLSRIGLIVIIEEENFLYYHDIAPPYFNIAEAARSLARSAGADLLSTHHLFPLEGHIKNTQHEEKKSPKTRHLPENISYDIADLRTAGAGSALAPKTVMALKKIVSGGGKALLWINRRGYASAIYCKDCGFTALCPQCDAPPVYHDDNPPHSSQRSAPAMVCHHCGMRTPPPRTCASCRGHNLHTRGTGIQRVAQELEKRFPSLAVFRIDSDSIETIDEELDVLNKFKNADKAVLCATEMLSKHPLYEPIADLAAIVNFDQIFYLPDFRTEEKIVHTVVRLNTLARQTIIQTYDPERALFDRMSDLRRWYEEEAESRKSLSYPPFSQLIRLKYRTKDPERADAQGALVERKLKHTGAQASPALPCFIPKVKGFYCREMIVRIPKPRSKNALEKRNAVLRLIPSEWEIMVDPKDIL